jgi:hypothetical protein
VSIRECAPGFDLKKEATSAYESDGVDADGKPTFKVEPGKVYEIHIYYHNNAKASMNFITPLGVPWTEADGAENRRVGPSISQGTKVSVSLPALVQAGERGMIQGQIWASNVEMRDKNGEIIIGSNDEPQRAVWDEVSFYADESVSMRFLPGSARHYNNFTDGAGLESSLVAGYDVDGNHLGGSGAVLTSKPNAPPGWVYGCAENIGYITTLRVQVVAAIDKMSDTARGDEIATTDNVTNSAARGSTFWLIALATGGLAVGILVGRLISRRGKKKKRKAKGR